MANSTSIVSLQKYKLSADRDQAVVKTSEIVVRGGATGIDTATGKVQNATDSFGVINLGMHMNGLTSQTAGAPLTGDGTEVGIYQPGGFSCVVSVTGASAITDKFKEVFAEDNQTFTLTRNVDNQSIGVVMEWISGTSCRVWFWSFETAIRYMQSGGSTRVNIPIGHVNSASMEGTSALDLASCKLNGFGKIVGFYANVMFKDAISAGDQDLSLTIDPADGGSNVNVTGGVLTLVHTATQGAIVDATAITALNNFSDGDVLIVKLAASGTGFTASQDAAWNLFITVEYGVV